MYARVHNGVMFDNARKTPRDWRRFRNAQKKDRARSWGQRLGAGTEQDPRSVRPELPLWSDRAFSPDFSRNTRACRLLPHI